MHMLLDHQAEIGYQSVDRVVFVDKEDLNPAQARSFIIVLSGQRSRKIAGSDLSYSVVKSTKRRKLSMSSE